MSYSIIKQSGQTTAYLKEFVVDTTAEIASLPTFPNCAIGSNCLVLSSSEVYMLGNDNLWHII